MTTDPASGDDSDGAPQPASGPMSKEVADWYERFTHGQLKTFQNRDNGQWYLYDRQRPNE